MEPVLLGRTVRFHPCLQGKARGSRTGAGRRCPAPRTQVGAASATLKTAPTFPPGSRCRGCWCPPCRSARPRGSPSPPRASSTLAAGRAAVTSCCPGRQSPASACDLGAVASQEARHRARRPGLQAVTARPGSRGQVHDRQMDKHKVQCLQNTTWPQRGKF